MTAVLTNAASRIGTFIVSVYNYLTSGEVAVSEHYSVLRHSRPFVFYRSTKTTVAVSIFGDKPLPKHRRVFLQKRGFRTGLFGWTVGGLLGGSKLPGLEVTPVQQEPYHAIPASLKTSMEADMEKIWRPYRLARQELLESMQVHIPVASGDGYFRLRITPKEKPNHTIAVSPVFRVGSVTWSSASPQGATVVGLLPELVVKSAFISANAAMWAAFYATFPIFKLAHWTPGPMKAFFVKNVYQYAGGPDPRALDDQYQVTERMKRAKENFNRKVPYGAASIRTIVDLEKDEELGRQGVAYVK